MCRRRQPTRDVGEGLKPCLDNTSKSVAKGLHAGGAQVLAVRVVHVSYANKPKKKVTDSELSSKCKLCPPGAFASSRIVAASSHRASKNGSMACHRTAA